MGCRVPRTPGRRSKVDSARDALSREVLAHVPVINFNFYSKAVFLCLMLRRIVLALKVRSGVMVCCCAHCC